jgi:hypothetical protein
VSSANASSLAVNVAWVALSNARLLRREGDGSRRLRNRAGRAVLRSSKSRDDGEERKGESRDELHGDCWIKVRLDNANTSWKRIGNFLGVVSECIRNECGSSECG